MALRRIGILLLFFTAGFSLWGQTVEKADSLMKECRFQDAIRAYIAARDEAGADKAQYALNMADFCAEPHVVARKRFSRKDFHLYYPLKEQAWRHGPNPLDSLGGIPLYFPKGAREVFYSALDKAGTRSLFVTKDLDSLWSAPRLLGEAFLSTGSEIYPMLSADRKTLYFASNGLQGLGGYDIYCSAWDNEKKCWGDPVNLGFPFNSAADDFLMADSDDSQYTLFASNRGCPADSVNVYVLEYEKSPARKEIRSAAELRKLLELTPVEDPTRIDNDAAVEGFTTGNATTQRYMRKMEESRALMDSISRHMAPGDTLLNVFRARLALVSAELREVEMSFLMNGAVAFEEDREVVGAELGYTFGKISPGPALKLKLGRKRSVPSFRVAPVGRFAQDNTLPPGLVYQILLFDSPTHADLDDIKGLSPVYERLGSNLRYNYLVGLFRTYDDALENLNVVRVLGFPAARIVAWQDGRAVSVK